MKLIMMMLMVLSVPGMLSANNDPMEVLEERIWEEVYRPCVEVAALTIDYDPDALLEVARSDKGMRASVRQLYYLMKDERKSLRKELIKSARDSCIKDIMKIDE